MPERGFDTGFWTKPSVRRWPPLAKLLFLYLWSNDHCNPAGIYQLDTETISFDTKIPQDELPGLLKSLSPKVEWYPDYDIIWVKNFLKRQAKSPKFVIAALKSLDKISLPEDLRAEWELYNQGLLKGATPSQHISLTKRECVAIRDGFLCQYCGKEIQDSSDYEMDHIIPASKGGKDNYLNLTTSCRSCNQKKFDKTPEEAGFKYPTPTTFHGAQAIYYLKNNAEVRQKWIDVFPSRKSVAHRIVGEVDDTLNNIDSMLNNIEPTVVVDPLICSTAATVSKSISKSKSISDEEEGVFKGKEELGNVSRLYEENIGQLTPMIADILTDIVDKYPAGWFYMALQEALVAGVRKLSYIEAILERWLVDGKDSAKKPAAVNSPGISDKFTSGNYGHMVSRTGGDLENIKKIRKEEGK